MIATIASREFRSLFLSPLAWSILAIVQLILSFFFLTSLEYFVNIQNQLGMMPNAPGLTQIVVGPLFSVASIVLLFVVPLLTMRLISGDRHNNSLSLLLSAPISMTEIVVGKYVGVLSFLCVMLTLIALMPLSLLFGATLDMGVYLCGLLGLFLVVASLAAIGLFISSMTAHPTVAAVVSFGIMLILWVFDLFSATGDKTELTAYISMLSHFHPMLEGRFNTRDLIYYLLFISTFIVLSIRRLDIERLQD